MPLSVGQQKSLQQPIAMGQQCEGAALATYSGYVE